LIPEVAIEGKLPLESELPVEKPKPNNIKNVEYSAGFL
jgi:hypothetical protein